MQSKSASTKMKCPKQCKKGISSVNECTDCCIQLSASANLFYLFSNQNRSFNLFVFLWYFPVARFVQCGMYGRMSSQQASGISSRGAYNNNPAAGNAGQYGNVYNYNTQSNVNGAGGRRNGYINQMDQPQADALNNKNQPRTGPAISAWGLITIIMLIIVIGMGGYYGILCYPLICKEERNYDIMDAASTTASANTPTRSGDFEKPGNYSSRSTTPSVIINT